MIIQKVINNNVVSTFDSNGKEVILMGKGIGFRKKTGDELDKTKIEKIQHIRDLQHIYNILRRKSYQRNGR